MNTEMAGFVGLEAFYSTIHLDVHCPEDAIVGAVHWALILSGFRCIGIDEQGHQTSTASGAQTDAISSSELLPKGWSDKTDIYTLKYTKENAVYTVKIIKVDNALLVNVLNSVNSNILATSINVDTNVNHDLSDHRAYKNPDALYDQISREITGQLNPPKTFAKESPANSRHSQQEYDQLRERRSPDRPISSPASASLRYEDDDPLSVGRGDLDPLGHSAGGMLMDPHRLINPFRQSEPRFGLPRGAIPPGARFDPFGPPAPNPQRPNRDRFAVPDPDHLPPPGYDDMFN